MFLSINNNQQEIKKMRTGDILVNICERNKSGETLYQNRMLIDIAWPSFYRVIEADDKKIKMMEVGQKDQTFSKTWVKRIPTDEIINDKIFTRAINQDGTVLSEHRNSLCVAWDGKPVLVKTRVIL
jgi:hypothetical protein